MYNVNKLNMSVLRLVNCCCVKWNNAFKSMQLQKIQGGSNIPLQVTSQFLTHKKTSTYNLMANITIKNKSVLFRIQVMYRQKKEIVNLLP